LLEDFLADAGLPVRDLAAGFGGASQFDGSVARLHISAAAGAVMAGAPAGQPSPTPEIPDLVAIVRPGPVVEAAPAASGSLWIGEWEPSWTPAEHASAIGAVRAAISRGDVYQANVVGHAAAPYVGDPGPALERVLALPGAAWAGRMAGPGWALACASPECLVTVRPADGGALVATRPIKGTAPRTPEGRRALRASAKERAEHVMIVDLARNDLGRIAAIGTVAVEELFVPRPWCGLWQAESTVSARLAPGVGLAEVLRAVCPGGSVTGAPKRAALGLLAGLEPVGRGPSMGALGTLGPDGLALGLTIRTVAAVATPSHPGRRLAEPGCAAGGVRRPGDAPGRLAGPGGGLAEVGGRLHVWAGGGITWSSVEADEVAEAAAKAAPLRAALATP
jgi:para-aminobenzoate synthetase component 1